VPVVILGHKAQFCFQFVNVETDDLQASTAMTKHLLDAGHRRIAYLSGPGAAPWAAERLEGYKRAYREAGIEYDENLIFLAGTSIDEGQKAALQLLNEGVSFTAIQACNDLVAIGAGEVLLKQSIQIPGQVSLAGFGNVLLSEYFCVPLTTVRQAKFSLGVAAIDSLRKLLRGEHPEPKRLHGELIVRASTGVPLK
jgi:DNA-binding LacI/PurR family transcriptional regulator